MEETDRSLVNPTMSWGSRPIPLGMGIMLRNYSEFMPLLFRNYAAIIPIIPPFFYKGEAFF